MRPNSLLQTDSSDELIAYESLGGDDIGEVSSPGEIFKSAGNTMYIEWTSDLSDVEPGFQVYIDFYSQGFFTREDFF